MTFAMCLRSCTWRRLGNFQIANIVSTRNRHVSAGRLSQSPSSAIAATVACGRRHAVVPVLPSEDSGKSGWSARGSFDDNYYRSIAFMSSTVFTLCRSRDQYRPADRRYDEVRSPSENRAAYDSRPDDDEDGVDIPIDFGVGNRSRTVRDRHAFHAGRGGEDGWWDRLKRYLSGVRQPFGSGGGFSWSSMGSMPWLANVTPTLVGNAILVCCGAVYVLWFMSDRLSSARLFRFMNRNFVASQNSLKLRRCHTLLTCAVSHSTLMHLLFNCMMLHQLMSTFERQMHPAGPLQMGIPTFERFLRTVSSSLESLFWPDSRPTSRRNGVQTSDILNVLLLSAVGSSLGHVCLYSNPVLGASGAVSGLLYLLASTFPNSYFRTVFPIPGMQLSILQVCQVFVATNLYFVIYGSGLRNIAWAAHLFGLGAGAAYCWLQQYVFKRPGFHDPVSLSLKTAKRQWAQTFKGKFFLRILTHFPGIRGGF
ncbi:rhomboid protease [Babesia ovata]|uniref:Rhomboid protease n=1 Tax=Babesia ovata TaxID=189622 RepID=A0A2H6KDX7_9APIC|nr:rhomboid protease [Babesia ovata]GBE61195.1 rhomboid protease [Babesia ovata]